MSHILCSSLGSKNYLLNNKEMNSSHPIFWSHRRPLSDSRSAEVISWSYPPKANICAKVLAQIGAKFANSFNSYANTPYTNPLLHRNSTIDEMLSTQVMKKMGKTLSNSSALDISSCASRVDNSCCNSSSFAERTAVSHDDHRREVLCNTCENTSTDSSDSSNERISKVIQINDKKVLNSMQTDRQKKKKRKRRRKKRKTPKLAENSDFSPQKCFSRSFADCRKDFISFLFDTESNYDSNDDMSSSEEMSVCLDVIGSDLEKMCKSLFVDYLFTNNSENEKNPNLEPNSGFDEIDFCHSFSNTFDSKEEEIEINEMNDKIRKANEKWSTNYLCVSSDTRTSTKVKFTADKPSVHVLYVWDYASRQARCGQWEQLARDRQRFAEKCRRIDSEIGYIFNREHRERAYRLRYVCKCIKTI